VTSEDLQNVLMSKIAAAFTQDSIAAAINTMEISTVLNQVIARAIEYYDWDTIIEGALEDIDLRGMLANKLRQSLNL
jgi:hypothetical protein